MAIIRQHSRRPIPGLGFDGEDAAHARSLIAYGMRPTMLFTTTAGARGSNWNWITPGNSAAGMRVLPPLTGLLASPLHAWTTSFVSATRIPSSNTSLPFTINFGTGSSINGQAFLAPGRFVSSDRVAAAGSSRRLVAMGI